MNIRFQTLVGTWWRGLCQKYLKDPSRSRTLDGRTKSRFKPAEYLDLGPKCVILGSYSSAISGSLTAASDTLPVKRQGSCYTAATMHGRDATRQGRRLGQGDLALGLRDLALGLRDLALRL